MKPMAGIKLLCSVGLLVFFTTLIDWKLFYRYCQQASWAWLSVCFGLMLALLLLHWVRWRRILISLSVSLPSIKGPAILLGGYFFNQFLPSSVGGDVYRIWGVQKYTSWLKAASSVILDRLLALVGLAVTYCVCYGLYQGELDIIFDSTLFVSLGLIAGYGVACLCAWTGWGELWLRKLPIRHFAEIWKAWQQLAVFNIQLVVMSLSIVIHLLNSLSFWTLLIAFNVDLGLPEVLVIFPVMLLVTTLPLSFAGWGIREGILIVLLGVYGVPLEQSLVISLMFGVLQLLVGLVSGCVWFTDSAKSMHSWSGLQRLIEQVGGVKRSKTVQG